MIPELVTNGNMTRIPHSAPGIELNYPQGNKFMRLPCTFGKYTFQVLMVVIESACILESFSDYAGHIRAQRQANRLFRPISETARQSAVPSGRIIAV